MLDWRNFESKENKNKGKKSQKLLDLVKSIENLNQRELKIKVNKNKKEKMQLMPLESI